MCFAKPRAFVPGRERNKRQATWGKTRTMARKILNRKELRAENEAAEADGKTKKTAKTEDGDKKKPVKRKSRAKTAKEVRLKAFWGVFNQSMKRVALFEYCPAQTGRQEGLRVVDLQQNPAFRPAGQGSHRGVAARPGTRADAHTGAASSGRGSFARCRGGGAAILPWRNTAIPWMRHVGFRTAQV